MLRYYSLDDEVIIQCDASQFGLGAALTQSGQPVAYASKVLTVPETRYAQIKELLAILFTCKHFDNYLFACQEMRVQTDHKLLEIISTKPLHYAQKRLQ